MIDNFERDLAAALAYVYGPVADTAGTEITAWRHKTLSQPSQAECEAAVVEYQTYMASIAYQEKRADAYPSYQDFLDAQVKINSGDQDLITEGEAQLASYIEACLAVKQQYPKPRF